MCYESVSPRAQVLCWEEGAEPSGGERVRVSGGARGPVGALFSGLKPSTPYLVTVRARNSAGLGPASPTCNVTTKKPRKTTAVIYTVRGGFTI